MPTVPTGNKGPLKLKTRTVFEAHLRGSLLGLSGTYQGPTRPLQKHLKALSGTCMGLQDLWGLSSGRRPRAPMTIFE